MGAERPGRLRVRIPTGPALIGNRHGPGTRNGTAPPAAPAPAPPPPTLEQHHARALDGMKRAQDRDTLDAWARWGEGFAFDGR